ncbi:hypothetical protein Tco_0442517 [Tanacetum coccineum]
MVLLGRERARSRSGITITNLVSRYVILVIWLCMFWLSRTRLALPLAFPTQLLTHRVAEELESGRRSLVAAGGKLGGPYLIRQPSEVGKHVLSTSDETADGILEAFYPESYHLQRSLMNLDHSSLGHYRMYRVDAFSKTHDAGIPLR